MVIAHEGQSPRGNPLTAFAVPRPTVKDPLGLQCRVCSRVEEKGMRVCVKDMHMLCSGCVGETCPCPVDGCESPLAGVGSDVEKSLGQFTVECPWKLCGVSTNLSMYYSHAEQCAKRPYRCSLCSRKVTKTHSCEKSARAENETNVVGTSPEEQQVGERATAPSAPPLPEVVPAVPPAATQGGDDQALPTAPPTTSSQRTPIMLSAELGNLEDVQLRLETVSLEDLDNNSASVLHYAAKGPNPEVVRLLLEKGCNVKREDKDGLLPSDVAALWGRVENLRILREAEKCRRGSWWGWLFG